MTISESLETFANRNIEEFDQNKGIQDASNAIRLSIGWDDANEGLTLLGLFNKLLADPLAGDIEALIIGPWEEAYESGIQSFIDELVGKANRLPRLCALFIGEMTYQECEISWIIQGNYSALWGCFPRLELFRVRGSSELTLGEIHQESLKELVIESGGLPSSVINEVTTASLPNLEKLELWLGDDNYGWEGDPLVILPLLASTRFPKLTVLGLRDSMAADQIAAMIVDSPLLEQLEELNLSLGTLGDEGACALLNAPRIKKLKRLDLSHHYISDALARELKQLCIEVDLSNKQKADEDDGESYRYVAVSE
ncbi:MAG: STM4015 family protein [Candidatus Thiodiazotropha sp.]